MNGGEVKIQIPQELINTVVRAEMVERLGDKQALIEAVVTSAMSAKDDRNYGRETYFEVEVRKLIVETAKDVFKEWIDSNREQIRDALLKYLNANKQKRLTEFAENLANQINVYGISVNLNLKSAGE